MAGCDNIFWRDRELLFDVGGGLNLYVDLGKSKGTVVFVGSDFRGYDLFLPVTPSHLHESEAKGIGL